MTLECITAVTQFSGMSGQPGKLPVTRLGRPNLKSDIGLVHPRQRIFSDYSRCDEVLFSGKTPLYSQAQRENLGKLMQRYAPTVPLEELVESIQRSEVRPVKGQEFRYGVLFPNAPIKTADPIFEKIGRFLMSRIPHDLIPSEGLPVLIRERGAETFPAVAAFLEKTLIPYFQINETLPVIYPKKNPKKREQEVKVLQTVLWPFFQQVISGNKLSESYQAFAKQLGELPLFELHAIGPEPLQKSLQQAFRPLKERLSTLEVATMQYSDRVHLGEVVTSMIAGSVLGAGGEILAHQAFPDGGAAAAAARIGLLTSVDALDGVCGEMGVLTSDLASNGMKLSVDNVYGKNADGSKKRWWQILAKPFQWAGKAGSFVKRATVSAIKGAIVGMGLSTPAGIAMSIPGASIAARATSGAAGTLGTATAIPFNIRASLPQVYLATQMLIRQGKISVPAEIKNDEKAVQQYVVQIATQDLLARLGFAASMKAYSLTPLSGLILLSETVGVPRETSQVIFMGVAPAMENLLRLILTMSRLKMTNPRNMAKAETMILDASGQPFSEKEAGRLKNLFVDRWGRSVAWLLTHFPFKVRLPEINDAKLPPKLPVVEKNTPSATLPISRPVAPPYPAVVVDMPNPTPPPTGEPQEKTLPPLPPDQEQKSA